MTDESLPATDSDQDQLPPPPPASFEGVVTMFASQAMASMGLMLDAPGPKRLDYAKFFIDLLEVLEKKTTGQLSGDEAKMLEGTLHQLRMIYVQQSK